MTPTERVQRLEALLERVQKNRTASPQRAAPLTSEPIALDLPPAPARAPAAAPVSVAPHTATPPMPFVSTPPAVAPPLPPVSARPAVPTPEPPVAESIATAAWAPEPGSGMQPRPMTAPPSLPPEEVSDEDLLEVTTIPPAPAADELEPAPELEVTAEVTLDRAILEPDGSEVSEITEVGEEQAPASSSRFKVPSPLEEALTGASEVEVEAEREIPIKTPPPESGPQEALPAVGLEASRTPDVEQLEADLDLPPSMGPTAEQLGETIELEPPRGPELEIDVTVEEEAPAASVSVPEELEVALPRPSLQSGLYDVTSPPPAAYPEPALAEAPPSVAVPPDYATVPVQMPAAHGPERTARPALGATDVAEVKLVRFAAPKTFAELLDATLGA